MTNLLIILLGIPVYNELLFSCCSPNSLFVFVFQQFRYNVSWYGSLWVLDTWMSFLDVYTHGFYQIWKVFSHYFFKYSMCPFLFSFWTLIMCLFAWRCSMGPLISVQFSLVFLFSDSVISIVVCSWFFIPPGPICLWVPLVNFSFQKCFCAFQLQKGSQKGGKRKIKVDGEKEKGPSLLNPLEVTSVQQKVA